MIKRIFDIVVSLFALILLFPFFIIAAVAIKISSQGPVFYLQERVGRDGVDFRMFKFRTMQPGSDSKGLLTIGDKDHRVTRIGYYFRKYKLDEFPQLLNVLLGEMSLVGPRPEVRKYVNHYTDQQRKVLTVKPGITDYASIRFSNESEILAKAADHEKEYIQNILPEKLRLNLKYLDEKSFGTDIRILIKTLVKLVT